MSKYKTKYFKKTKNWQHFMVGQIN